MGWKLKSPDDASDQAECPLWVKSRHVQRNSLCPPSAKSGLVQDFSRIYYLHRGKLWTCRGLLISIRSRHSP